MTVIADSYDGKPLNSPNDIVPHPDGSIWFTDPPYGGSLAEGHPDEPGGPGNPQGLFNPRIGSENAGAIGGRRRELSTNVYRRDPSGRLDAVITEDQLPDPNGICFSPDYKTLYVADTGSSHYPNAPRNIRAYDVADSVKLSRGREFVSMKLAMPTGEYSGIADGIRADVEGNIYAAAGWVGPGYDGVHVFAPDGVRIGQILLPEICANVCFGGPKRNRLFMAASQSLYVVYLDTRGAHFA